MLSKFVVFVLFGIVVGAVGRLMVVGGSHEPASNWIGHGILGAVFGGVLGLIAAGRAPEGGTVALLASYVGAIAFVALHRARRVWAQGS